MSEELKRALSGLSEGEARAAAALALVDLFAPKEKSADSLVSYAFGPTLLVALSAFTRIAVESPDPEKAVVAFSWGVAQAYRAFVGAVASILKSADEVEKTLSAMLLGAMLAVLTGTGESGESND